MSSHTGAEPVVACRAEDVPDGGCLPVADDRVLLTRVDGRVVGWHNRCLHRDTPLHTGVVRDGVLTCPAHFWRYDLATGCNVTSGVPLGAVPVEVTDEGEVLVWPPLPPAGSIRDVLLAHARAQSRNDDPPTRRSRP